MVDMGNGIGRSRPRRGAAVLATALAVAATAVARADEAHPVVGDFAAETTSDATVSAAATEGSLVFHVPAELRFHATMIPDRENAYTSWRKAINKFRPLEGAGLNEVLADVLVGAAEPDADERQALEKWLKSNRTALKLLDKGIVAGQCRFPLAESYATRIDVEALKALARAKLLRGRLLASEGDHAAGLTEVLGGLYMGEIIQYAEGTLVEYLTGQSIIELFLSAIPTLVVRNDLARQALTGLSDGEAVAANCRNALLRTHQVDADHTVHLVHQIAAEPASLLESMMKKERAHTVFTHSLVQSLYPYEASKRPDEEMIRRVYMYMLRVHARPLDKVATVKRYCDQVQVALAHSSMPWATSMKAVYERADSELAALRADFRPFLDLVQHGNEYSLDQVTELKAKLQAIENPVGRLLAYELAALRRQAMAKTARTQTLYELTRLLVAVQLFQIDYGRPPGSLNELVLEGILGAPPVDPYSGEPLGYSPEKGLVWSVGEDGVDNGGRRNPSLGAATMDIVWELPGERWDGDNREPELEP